MTASKVLRHAAARDYPGAQEVLQMRNSIVYQVGCTFTAFKPGQMYLTDRISELAHYERIPSGSVILVNQCDVDAYRSHVEFKWKGQRYQVLRRFLLCSCCQMSPSDEVA
jgi:hypothetical protein